MFSLEEIRKMEREMCSYLEWKLHFHPAKLAEFEAKVCNEASSRNRPSVPLPSRLLLVSFNVRQRAVAVTSPWRKDLRCHRRSLAACGTSGHRLFISAFMIASKVVCDDTYPNRSWCVVSQGMFSLEEISQMEREMCSYLEWKLNFHLAKLAEFEAKVRKEASSRNRPGP
ncbi:hypothetical protein EXIGLDRAFT_784613 [Exidia glandulosa HHB12029]|uniref:Cyclin N-terminal domain-containing protein n=1 Tax=Exidia glandulosa HHB12029 TaxID=1314781 RepID=A0A166MD56_EXIGL|nr:hypothetical protein EXIGLDRAFT_784613 [Exidia glandulosa HHB12029]